MLVTIRPIRLSSALRLADAMPGRDHQRTCKHGELAVDLLRPSVNAELGVAEPKDR